MKFCFFGLILSILIVACAEKSSTSDHSDYDATLKIHLDAIQNHDLTALLSTVHDSVTLIFPNGQRLKSKKEFASFHQNWFNDSTWTLRPAILKTIKSDSVSYSLIQYQYNDIDSMGTRINPRSNYLLLVFKQGTDGWKLVHDQNTRIATE
jgi:ketosteroid isomerase-like protein